MLGAMLACVNGYVATPESNFKNHFLEKLPDISGAKDSRTVIQFINNHWRFKIWKLRLPDEFLNTNKAISFSDILDRLVQLYAAEHGSSEVATWIDHSPDNIGYVRQLLMLFPDSKFIHLVRDGRAVASSVMPLNWGPNTILASAKWWKEWVERGLLAERSFPSKVLRVKYEDVVLQPEATLRKICDFCNLEYSSAMVSGKGFVLPSYLTAHGLVGRPPQTDRVMSWRNELTNRQVQIFENFVGETLSELGYEKETGGQLVSPLGRMEGLRMAVKEKYKYRINKVSRQVRKIRIRSGLE